MKVKAANEKWPFLLLSWFYGFHREEWPYLGSLLGSGYTHFYACHKSLKRKPLFCSLPNLHKNTYEFEFEITSLHIFFFLFFRFRFHSRIVFKPIVIEVTLITFVKASLMKLSLMRFYCCNYFISDCFLLFQIHPKFPALNALCFLALEIVTFWLALSKRSHVPTWVTIIHTPIICSLWQIDNHISEIRVARARAENIDYLQ